MTGPQLADRLRAGETLLCGWSALAEPIAAEALARAGFDAVCLDGQHGFQDFRSFRDSVASVLLGGGSPVARVPYGATAEIGRVVDMGVEAVICPMVNTRADAERLVRIVKFPPVGERSWGPFRIEMLWGMQREDFLARANDLVLAFAMIETAEALDNLDGILAVEGIDGVFVGPYDLAISMARGSGVDPSGEHVVAALAEIGRISAKAGRHAAIYAASPDLVPRYRDWGYRLIAGGADIQFLRHGAAAFAQAMREAR